MDIPKTHQLFITEAQGDDAGSILFNKLIKGESVTINGTKIDAEKAINKLVDQYAWQYEMEYMSDDI